MYLTSTQHDAVAAIDLHIRTQQDARYRYLMGLIDPPLRTGDIILVPHSTTRGLVTLWLPYVTKDGRLVVAARGQRWLTGPSRWSKRVEVLLPYASPRQVRILGHDDSVP